ncbi:MAG: hypothetical protein JWN00_138 [Actinomycetia bacterium]|nr:hypothetical protein [Actinomycetes bacterium]
MRDIGVWSRGTAVRLPAALAATTIGLLTVAEPSIAAPGPRPTRHGHTSESVHVRVPGVGVDIGEKNVLVTIRSPHPVSSALVQVLVPPVEVQILPRPVVPVRSAPVAPAVPPAPAVPRPRVPPAAPRTTALVTALVTPPSPVTAPPAPRPQPPALPPSRVAKAVQNVLPVHPNPLRTLIVIVVVAVIVSAVGGAAFAR